jgi:hypothetical protein
MSVTAGDIIDPVSIRVRDPDSGTPADRAFTAALWVAGAVTATAVTVAPVGVRPANVGRYKASFTVPAVQTGDELELILTDTLSGDEAVVWSSTATTGGPWVVTPLGVTVNSPRYATRNLATVTQGSAPTDVLVITDAAGEPIDLSGRTLKIVAALVTDAGEVDDKFDDTLEGRFAYTTADGELTVGGADDNQLSILHDATNTATAGNYRYWLWDVTNAARPIVLVKGRLPIEPAAFEVDA